MRRMNGLWALLLIAGLISAAGCEKAADPNAPSSGSGSTTGAGGKKKIIIGFIGKSLGNDVFQAATAGAKAAAKDLSAKYNVEVVIEERTPSSEDAQKQALAIESLMNAGAQGIALSCSEANTVTDPINRAVAKGLFIMAFDSDAPNSKRQYFYGTADKTAGERVMTELATAMGDSGKIAILAGNESAPNLQNRVAGVRDELKKHANMSEVGTYNHIETPEKAAEKVASVQNANGEIQGWAFVGGWPLFVDKALPWEPGKVKVVSMDALPKQLAYLTSGHVAVLLGQDCYGWGYKSVETLVEKIANNKDPEKAVMFDPLTRVTKENAEEYAGKWKQWLGK